jgi:hypothetical protein
MNPIEDGDIYLSPMNMVPADMVEEIAAEPDVPPPAPNDGSAFKRLAIEAAQRAVNKEVKAVGNAWKKHAKSGKVEDFNAWATKFYGSHGAYLQTTMRAVFDEWAAASHLDQSSSTAIFETLCNVDGTLSSLSQVVETDPAAVPQFLSDLNDTFADSIVADIETALQPAEEA